MKRTSLAGHFAFYLALQGLLLRAFLPAGYMPAHDAQGWRLAFCTAQGASISPDPHPAAQPHADSCPYAVALASTLPPSLPAVSFAAPAAAAFLAPVAAPRRATRSPYSARGPPTLV